MLVEKPLNQSAFHWLDNYVILSLSKNGFRICEGAFSWKEAYKALFVLTRHSRRYKHKVEYVVLMANQIQIKKG